MFREELSKIRERALALHTRLIEGARVEYAHHHDRLPTPTELLQLLAYDEDFQWLKPLTKLIVWLDEKLESETVTEVDVAQARLAIEQLASGEELEPRAAA